MQIRQSHVVLDACCILNFCASGHFLEILRAIPAKAIVALVVQDYELETLRQLENQVNPGATQFEAALDQRLLTAIDFESELEAEHFVNYVAMLDDGEAATCAIAVHRGWAIATDDKKAIAFFQQAAPHLQILSTLEIVKHWSEKVSLDASALKSALSAIRFKGRYMPPRSHPLLNWWETAMK
jgi:predicted nucleic acid-binding protein